MCEIKVDECFFDGPRKGEKGRVAAGKTPVFVPDKKR